MKKARRQRQAQRALDQRRPSLVVAQAAATAPAGGWLRAVREALGMTTADVAARLDVAPSSVTRFVTGNAPRNRRSSAEMRSCVTCRVTPVRYLKPLRP